MAGTCQIDRKWLLVFSARFSESWRPAARRGSSAKDRLLPSAAWMKCEEWSLSRILGCLVAKLLIPFVYITLIQRVKWQVRGRLICSFTCWLWQRVGFPIQYSVFPIHLVLWRNQKGVGLLGGGGGVTLDSLGQTSCNLIQSGGGSEEAWFSGSNILPGCIFKEQVLRIFFFIMRVAEGLKASVFLAKIFFSVVLGLVI